MKLLKWGILLIVLAGYEASTQTKQSDRPYLKEAAITQTAGITRIDANSPRPLVQILDALRQKYGWAIDYEDPQYIAPEDVLVRGGSRIPAGGRFHVEFPATISDEEKILRLMVDSYNHSDNPGRFTVRRNAEGNFLIVGLSAHDENGAISPQSSLLDTPISVETDRRTITATLDLICEQLKAETKTDVTLGVSPRSLLDRNTIKLGGSKIPARELLMQSLMAAHYVLYCRLLFDPDSKQYFLNVHSMPKGH